MAPAVAYCYVTAILFALMAPLPLAVPAAGVLALLGFVIDLADNQPPQ